MESLRDFGFLLNDFRRRYVLRFEERACQISMTLPQCRVLAGLARNEGISQVKLADLADVEPMAMVRILDHMEAGGLLERRADQSDRRIRRLFLTDKARPLIAEIWRLSDITRGEVFEGVSREHRDIFIGVLAHLHGNICALEGQSVDAPAVNKRPRNNRSRL